MKYIPHPYQVTAARHALKNKYCGLILEMGLGKTVITLTVLKELVYSMEILKPLIIAPKLVTEQTWTSELDKWDHLKGLTISRIIGTPAQRIAAINTPADIYCVSRDNIAWLVDYCGTDFPFDMAVLDEWSSFKSRTSARFKAVKKVRGYLDRVIGLTGTPAPNGLLDLWPQLYLLDRGKRLEINIGGYRTRYFRPIHTDQYRIDYVLREGSEEAIYDKIKDICISMRAKDWLNLKPRIDRVQHVLLPDIKAYKSFERDKILELMGEGEKGITINTVNAGGLYNKLLQYCNGAVYDEDGNYHVVNDTKLDILEEDIEALNGKPVIIFYQFKSDITRIKERIPGIVKLKGTQQIDAWNRGEIPVLLAHAASAGHGLNLQDGGYNLIWFGLPWSLELYQQAVARVDRQGQIQSVVNKILIVKGSVEELVLSKLLKKDAKQNELILALRAHVYEKLQKAA